MCVFEMKKEIYFSSDIETDGPIPGPHSMLSFASAAYVKKGESFKMVGTFSANLEQMEGATMDQRTKEEFWDKNPEAWEACRKDLQKPEDAMKFYVDWVKQLEKEHKAKAVFVAYPAGFDFMFVYWYLIKFTGNSPFSFSALDLKSAAVSLLKKGYRSCSKKNMPKSWFGKRRHTHVALDDALEQGDLFCNMMKGVL